MTREFVVYSRTSFHMMSRTDAGEYYSFEVMANGTVRTTEQASENVKDLDT